MWKKDPVEAFFDKISPEPNSGCWLWIGKYCQNGSGEFAHNPSKTRESARRFAFRLNNELLRSDEVKNCCGNVLCVNPAHHVSVKKRHGVTFEDAFNSNFEKNAVTGCWDWTGKIRKRDGYATFTHRPSNTNEARANRISWRLFHNKDLQNDVCVLHKCDNRKCVNPDHLFVGSQRDNVEDMCYKHRHNFGEDHPHFIHGRYVGDKRNNKYHEVK